MARVSIDGASSSSSASAPASKSGGASPKPAKTGKGGAGAGLDKTQKIKAAIAVGVIALAGLFIAWNAGMFESGPQIDANAAPDATPQEAAAFEEAQKASQQQPKTSGNTRLPPMPLGSN